MKIQQQTPRNSREQQQTATKVQKAKEIAKFFGVGLYTIRQWISNGMPGKPGAYDLAEIHQWRETRRKEYEQRRRSQDPDVEWKRHRAALMKLRFLRERGSLVPREDHERIVLRLCSVFRTALLGLAPSLKAQLADLDDQARSALIDARFSQLMEDVSANAVAAASATKKKRRGITSRASGSSQ